MPSPGDATLQDRDGRTVLRFERLLPHPPERVWSGLTDPEEQADWHPSPYAFEGGVARAVPMEGKPAMPDGDVTEFDPPRVLEHTWGEDVLRWELHPRDEGCLLVLTHTFDDHFKAARDAAGWHVCLDDLGTRLAGREPGAADGTGLAPGWRKLNSTYQERFGISPDRATPIPTREGEI